MAKLYIMVGVPGSGKTTYALNELKNAVYIGSDAVRYELYGNEKQIVRGYRRVHRILEERIIQSLSRDDDVVVDCSNITRNARKRLINLAPEGTEIIVIFIDKPLRITLKNNLSRMRHVPGPGIICMKILLQKPAKSEGIDRIIHICAQK